jgi:hypothetical protein
VAGEIDSVGSGAAEPDAFGEQALPLLAIEVLGERPVRA